MKAKDDVQLWIVVVKRTRVEDKKCMMTEPRRCSGRICWRKEHEFWTRAVRVEYGSCSTK